MKKALIVALVFSAFASTQSQATPFGFAAAGSSTDIPQGYQGFDWTGGFGTNSWISDTVSPIDSDYGVAPTALGSAWSNGGTSLTMTSATPGKLFNFGSVSLDAGTEMVTIDGLLDGKVVDTWSGEIVKSPTYTNVILDWTNIDTVTFSQGNSNLFVTNINTQLVPMPEPASLALFGAGLLGLAMLRRKGGKA